jgi:arylsulfatase A-like enzyme
MSTKSNTPNVLFLFSDQFNARCLSSAGHPDVQTPNLDRLANEGLRFENAYTQNPVCTPSRMSFLSGLYPSTHGYYGLYGREPEQKMTSMFAYFREQGYRTGALGKLHTPRYWIEKDCQFVYDEFIEHPKYLEGAGLYDVNDNRPFTGNRNGESSAIPLEHSCEVVLAQQTIRFLRNQGEPADRGVDEAPWFAWVSFSRPHSPLTPSEPFSSMYEVGENVTFPPSADQAVIAKQPQRIRMVPGTKQPPKPGDIEKMLPAYLGLVSQVDHGIGLILDELEAQGVLDNTIIVFSADHGDYAGEHGLWSKYGGISTRAITRVPFIVRHPGNTSSGEACEEIIEAVDLFPTLCELADLPIPDHVQGLSFASLMGDDPQSIRDSALTENAHRKALATKGWRYVTNIGDQPDELYDQNNDPWEVNNLIDDPDYADVVRQLQRQLLDRVAQARRPITTMEGGSWRHQYDRDGRVPDPNLLDRDDVHL